MGSVGYAYLKQQLHLSAFGPERAAALAPVTRITRTARCLIATDISAAMNVPDGITLHRAADWMLGGNE